MPSADQVPTNNSHSRMLWHEWVVLIAGSTGSALRAVRPPNLHITPVVRRDLVYRASATGSLYLVVTDDGERAGHEQAAQIAVTLLADIAKPVLASTRVLLRHDTDPGREVAP